MLDLSCNIRQPDDLYDRLVAMHRDLDERQSAVVMSKLVLLLANHIGDETIVFQAIEIALRQDSTKADLPQAMTLD